jgi:hypothetical protein
MLKRDKGLSFRIVRDATARRHVVADNRQGANDAIDASELQSCRHIDHVTLGEPQTIEVASAAKSTSRLPNTPR